MPHPSIPETIISSLRLLCVLILVSVFSNSFCLGDDQVRDPIRAKVDKARMAYQADMEKLKDSVTVFMEKSNDAARKSGDKPQLDAIKKEVDEFTNRGVIPASAPEGYHKKQLVTLQKMELALESAVKEYTKKGKDADASPLSTELDAVRKILQFAEIRKHLVGTGKMTAGGYVAELVFSADGTGKQTTRMETITWAVEWEHSRVTCSSSNGFKEYMNFPINPQGTKGVNSQGNTLEFVKKR